MLKRIIAVVLTVVLAFAGCSSETGSLENMENQAVYSVSYFYSFGEDVDYATQELQTKLNDFGELGIVEVAAPVTETFTEIPEPENDAKGVSPVHIVMPKLDFSKYSESYTRWNDLETGLEVCACYRVVAGMRTDELIKVYIDSDGNIIKYETANQGKYDELNLDEKLLEQKFGTFKNEIQQALGSSIFEFSASGLFTDVQGNVVLSTEVSLTDEGNPDQSRVSVRMYAALTQLN